MTEKPQPSSLTLVENQEIPPFRNLGYLAGIYYYYSRGEQAVVALPSGMHGKKSLYRLAPHEYWIKKYPGKKDDFDENIAVSSLMGTCQQAGIFDIERIRGRGIWMENGKPVIHYGNAVSWEGANYSPFLVPSKSIYEVGIPLSVDLSAKPISDIDGARFPDLIKQLSWQTNQQFVWLTGWLVCAMVGGALYWRPHLWLTGAAESGKSTLSDIINRILGKNRLFIQSVSTEAGIRQSLGADSIPVVMDEAEREDAHSHARLQSILTLARQASSNTDSKIVKGTPTGKALNYLIRSCFCLSSINGSLMQTADKGRFTQIELSAKKLSGDKYELWCLEIGELLTDDYVNGLYNRIIKLIPLIVHNAKMLALAIEAKTGGRRLGDQYGALIAGFISYYSDEKLTKETAGKQIEFYNFDLENEQAKGKIDQFALLDKIMQHVIKIPKERGWDEISIADLCNHVHIGVDVDKQVKMLGNIGIKVKDSMIYIANDNNNLGEILKGSRWPVNWAQTLKRLPFATSSEKPVYFSYGCKPRATIIPVDKVIQEDD